MEDEKLKILEMIKDGTISSEEGLKLLEALEAKEGSLSSEILPVGKAKWLRIRVFDPNEGVKAKINIPIAIVKIALNLGGKYSKDMKEIEGIDVNEIIELIQSGAEGKIVDIEQDDGTRIEVTVE